MRMTVAVYAYDCCSRMRTTVAVYAYDWCNLRPYVAELWYTTVVCSYTTTIQFIIFLVRYFTFSSGLEPRILTRWDCHAYARRAYDMGIRYIGACCGMEPYHVRAFAEELKEERGKLPPGHVQHAMWGEGLKMHTKPWVRAR